jgi:endoglucanase
LGSTREVVVVEWARWSARTASAPDCCVAVDVTHGLTPDAPKTKSLKLGMGASIGVGRI